MTTIPIGILSILLSQPLPPKQMFDLTYKHAMPYPEPVCCTQTDTNLQEHLNREVNSPTTSWFCRVEANRNLEVCNPSPPSPKKGKRN